MDDKINVATYNWAPCVIKMKIRDDFKKAESTNAVIIKKVKDIDQGIREIEEQLRLQKKEM